MTGRYREALERIVEMAERSDAHPDLDFGQVAREALQSSDDAGTDAVKLLRRVYLDAGEWNDEGLWDAIQQWASTPEAGFVQPTDGPSPVRCAPGEHAYPVLPWKGMGPCTFCGYDPLADEPTPEPSPAMRCVYCHAPCDDRPVRHEAICWDCSPAKRESVHDTSVDAGAASSRAQEASDATDPAPPQSPASTTTITCARHGHEGCLVCFPPGRAVDLSDGPTHDVPTDVLQALAEVERYRADNTLMAQHNADLVREVAVTREALQRIFYWSAGKPGIEAVWTIARDALAGVGSAGTTVTFPPSHRWYVDALYGPFDWDSANHAADLIMDGLLKLDASDDTEEKDAR